MPPMTPAVGFFKNPKNIKIALGIIVVALVFMVFSFVMMFGIIKQFSDKMCSFEVAINFVLKSFNQDGLAEGLRAICTEQAKQQGEQEQSSAGGSRHPVGSEYEGNANATGLCAKEKGKVVAEYDGSGGPYPIYEGIMEEMGLELIPSEMTGGRRMYLNKKMLEKVTKVWEGLPGEKFTIVSAYRSCAHQANVSSSVKADAGKSNHQKGIAIDISTTSCHKNSCDDAAAQALRAVKPTGFYNEVGNDRIHFSPSGG